MFQALQSGRPRILTRTILHAKFASRTVIARCAMFSGPGSDKLRQTSCGGACSKDTPKITEEELPDLLAAIPAWKVNQTKDQISRKFTARNFKAAVEYFNKVQQIADAEGHHPDLHLTNYREVELVISTHAVGGLTYPDFVLASKLDAVECDYSPKWLKEQQANSA